MLKYDLSKKDLIRSSNLKTASSKKVPICLLTNSWISLLQKLPVKTCTLTFSVTIFKSFQTTLHLDNCNHLLFCMKLLHLFKRVCVWMCPDYRQCKKIKGHTQCPAQQLYPIKENVRPVMLFRESSRFIIFFFFYFVRNLDICTVLANKQLVGLYNNDTSGISGKMEKVKSLSLV